MIKGCGVDIIEVKRIKGAIKRWGDDFLKRIFTQRELEQALNKPSIYEHLAGRFAAKEAVSKALGINDIAFKDIEIINNDTGKPVCILLKANKDKSDIHISISHIKNYAVATAIITKKNQ